MFQNDDDDDDHTVCETLFCSMTFARRYTAGNAGNASSPFSRVAGFVFTLVPTRQEEREGPYEELSRVAQRVYGGFEGALAKNPKDCSPGFGCVSFAKFIAAKRSSYPSLHELQALKGKIPPVMVLANRAAVGHPVENGASAAEAMGGDFHEAETFEQAARQWPRLIAKFVAKVAAKEGVKLSDDEQHLSTTTTATTKASAAADDAAAAGVFSDVADGLTLTREELLRSSRMCVGDPAVFPQMTEGCKSYDPGTFAPPHVTASTSAWSQAWLDNPKDPALALYQRTGLSVGECVKVGLVAADEFLKDGDLVSV